MAKYHKPLTAIVVIGMLLTGIWAIIWIGPLVNRVRLILNQDDYQAATLTIESLEFERVVTGAGDQIMSWDYPWAVGRLTTETLDFPNERVHIIVEGDPIASQAELEAAATVGEQLDVWFNPNISPDVRIQGEHLRVVHDYNDYWADQRVLALMIARNGMLPFFVFLAGFAVLRLTRPRSRAPEPDPSPTTGQDTEQPPPASTP